MKKRFKLLYLVGFLSLVGCSTTSVQMPPNAEGNLRTVYISTNMNNSQPIELSQDRHKKITEITLPKRAFKILTFPSLKNTTAIQVCASKSPIPILEIRPDLPADENRCFGGASGMAMAITTPPNYDVPLIISNGDSHNYYYSERRVNEITKSTVNVNAITTIDNTPISEAYVIVFIDENEDKIINKNELWFAKIIWE